MADPRTIPHNDRRVAAEGYRSAGCAIVRGVIGSEGVAMVRAYLDLVGHNGGFSTESVQVPGSFVLYGDPLMDSIMASFAALVGEVVGTAVEPTYSYVRVYRRGDVLERHTDRPACEHSMTVHLASSEDSTWPIHFEDLDGNAREVELGVGDAALYLGRRLPHWRSTCEVDWYLQAFFHYVDPLGPAGSHVTDRRGTLGVKRSAQTEVER